jgi:hypothetical protein
MTLAATLIVTVLAVGGPQGAKPRPLQDVRVRIAKQCVARVRGTSSPEPPPMCRLFLSKPIVNKAKGTTQFELQPGSYGIASELVPAHGSPRPCQSANVVLKTAHTTRVTLRCSIK